MAVMIARLDIIYVEDEDLAKPYRMIAYDENGDRITQVRYDHDYYAMGAARVIRRDMFPNVEIRDLVKKDERTLL